MTGNVYSQVIVEVETFIQGQPPSEYIWTPPAMIEILGASFYCTNTSDHKWFAETGLIRPANQTGAYAKVLGGPDAHRKYLGLHEHIWHGGSWGHFRHDGIRVDPEIGEHVYCAWWSAGLVAPVIVYIMLQYREV